MNTFLHRFWALSCLTLPFMACSAGEGDGGASGGSSSASGGAPAGSGGTSGGSGGAGAATTGGSGGVAAGGSGTGGSGGAGATGGSGAGGTSTGGTGTGGTGGTGTGGTSAGGTGGTGVGGTGGADPGGCWPGRSTFMNHGSEGFFACAANAQGTGQCWGEGFFSATPKKLLFKDQSEVAGIVQFAAVGYNGCVLLDTGAVHCWTSGDQSQAPNEPVIAADVVAISGGYTEACALVRPAGGGANVQCWNVEQHAAPEPVQLEASDEPIAIASGYKNACVVLADGRIKCWGSNGNGQLGSGPGGDSAVPKATADLGGTAIDVTVGNEHVCALLEGGSVKCWGQYNDGKLGFAATNNYDVPGPAAIASGAAAIAAGKWHTCAVMQDRTLQCWGKGPIGSGETATPVAGLTDVAAVSGGRDYACVITSAGALKCWGSGAAGSLGNATPTDVPSADGGAFVASVPELCQ